ncbi:hypothetical protein GMSM_18590 [Geomonas sp. Red276]
MKIGRNDLCPCGSGIKYKKCCAGKQDAGGHPSMGEVMGELREVLEGQSFGSIEEVNAFLRQHMERRSQAPIDDFHGLSSEQMHRLLYFPFETPELFAFPSRLDIAPEAPIMALFNLLADGIGEDGLKATATGNLPRNFCRETALAYLGDEGYRHRTRYGGINSEPDFSELHVSRIIAESAGLVRKYKGKFILSLECRKIMKEAGASGIYPRLFRAFAREYNWGYQDRYEEVAIVQQSFLFTIYLLQRYGSDWRTSDFYAENFLRAFPMAVREVPPSPYWSQEETITRCYTLRALERFAEFAGLVEIERDPKDKYSDHFRLRKLALVDHVVHLQV